MISSDSARRRHQACALLQRLVDPHRQHDTADAAALRHLAIAALNLAQELSPEVLASACARLPLVPLYAAWEEGKLSPDALTRELSEQGLIIHQGEDAVRRRLERAHALACTTAIHRAPRQNDEPQTPTDDPRQLAMARVMLDEQALGELLELPAARALDRLVAQAGLMASVIESPHITDFEELLPPWPIERRACGLTLLRDFEDHDYKRAPLQLSQLKQRSQDFERSLIANLEQQGLLVAVRVALAFAPASGQPMPSTRELQHYLARFTLFADDPALLALARALIETRHLFLHHLQGALPLASLQPWTNYLRGDCAELADSRDITLREATHYAHYCLHVLNLSDLSAMTDLVLREPLRQALKLREEELRELVLAGQRQGLSDKQADLARFERASWRAEGPRAALADRLARLCGAWRQGEAPAPLGARARLEAPLLERATETLDLAGACADALANLAAGVVLQGHRLFESLELQDALRLLALALAAARDAGLLEGPAAAARIDLRPLLTWLDEDPDQGHHLHVLRQLLARVPLDAMLSTSHLHASSGLRCEPCPQKHTLQVELAIDPALEALLTLLAATPEHDALHSALTQRLHTLLAPRPPAAHSSQYSERNTTDSELSG
ncbi:hypothetical protein DL240_09565 [Lujinxingia litoralis]|uniref:Uncharacterized protein n=2 Tax=Lujinxingia litoralis TaxID=2211119 RepID=A0A328C8X6_9DELT|nr:hypothetical protein DL240_09565 [Lujinxingia litoralis]